MKTGYTLSRSYYRYIIYVALIYASLAGLYLLGYFDSASLAYRKMSSPGSSAKVIVVNEEVASASLQTRPEDSLQDISRSNTLHEARETKQTQENLIHEFQVKLQHAQLENDKLKSALAMAADKISMVTQHMAAARTEQVASAVAPLASPPSSLTTSAARALAFSRPVFSRDLPPSSVYCNGLGRHNRTCKIKNFCYRPKTDDFFIIKGNTSVFHNVPLDPYEALVDLTSLEDHSVFFFKYIEVREHVLQDVAIQLVDEPTFILDRFHPGNIMHAIHDDFIGLYYQLKMYAPASCLDPFESTAASAFSKRHHILFMDGFASGDYGGIFAYLSDYPIRFKADLSSEAITCFREAYVGQSKEANWYQYGFSEPQGPIANKTVSGYRLREVGSHVLKSLGLPTWDRSAMVYTLRYMRSKILVAESHRSLSRPEETYIALFSRRQDRLMVNEDDMAAALQSYYGLPVVFIRNEDMSFEEQVRVLRKTAVAVGMHGSLLVMSLFLPPGAVLIELYPFAVPADNYTPYNAMSRLHGMELVYRSWTNTHPANNIPHPEYPEHHGGIMSFSKEEQEKILNTTTVPSHLCCTNPYWLFRIYQDTVVNVTELLATISDAVIESSEQLREPEREEDISVAPATIKSPIKWSLVRQEPHEQNAQPPLPAILLSWEVPWNVPSVEKYGVWVHQTYQEYFSPKPEILLTEVCSRVAKNETLEIWIRSYYRHQKELAHTDWGAKLECHCGAEQLTQPGHGTG